jgi:hypothetical protein
MMDIYWAYRRITFQRHCLEFFSPVIAAIAATARQSLPAEPVPAQQFVRRNG